MTTGSLEQYDYKGTQDGKKLTVNLEHRKSISCIIILIVSIDSNRSITYTGTEFHSLMILLQNELWCEEEMYTY